MSPSRGENAYRYYDQDDLLRLEYLSVMKYARFSLEEIKVMFELLSATPSPSCKTKTIDLLTQKKVEIAQRIGNYTQILRALSQIICTSEKIESYPEEQTKIDDFIHQIHQSITFQKEFE